jgi:D-aspartate ligase
MEFKRDERSGVYKLLEINGRHNLSSMLAIETGINFPYIHYSHLAYQLLPEAIDFKKGIYWIDLIRDLGYSLKYLRQEKYSLKSYIIPYLKPHVFAILSRDDPKPFVKRISAVLQNLVS